MGGRFAPSPTGELHLGNLRTAAIAWLSARSAGRPFVMRVEDLDRVQSSPEHERRQLDDLASIGLDWDGDVVRQSERFDVYEEAIGQLRVAGLVYECFCSRREIRQEIEAAPQAPHRPPGSYPGTCRRLTAAELDERRSSGRPPALRLRSGHDLIEFDDVIAGAFRGAADDVVLRRNDGVPAYNLAVVVDDGAQSITEICRGDDLLDTTPRQILLQRLLRLATPDYLHVPLVLGPTGERLAKRDGAVTLTELRSEGVSAETVVSWIAESLGLARPGEKVTLADLVDRFDPSLVPREPCRMPYLT